MNTTSSLLLRIQDEDDVRKGVCVLKGLETPPEDGIVQFSYTNSSYDEDQRYIVDYDSRDDERRRRYAFERIGAKGDEAVLTLLADSIARCRVPGLHVKFSFCNLSESAIFRLADAIEMNTSLKGFTCMQNPYNWPNRRYEAHVPCDKRMEQALIVTRAPIEVWTNDLTYDWYNNTLPDNIKDARRVHYYYWIDLVTTLLSARARPGKSSTLRVLPEALIRTLVCFLYHV